MPVRRRTPLTVCGVVKALLTPCRGRRRRDGGAGHEPGEEAAGKCGDAGLGSCEDVVRQAMGMDVGWAIGRFLAGSCSVSVDLGGGRLLGIAHVSTERLDSIRQILSVNPFAKLFLISIFERVFFDRSVGH